MNSEKNDIHVFQSFFDPQMIADEFEQDQSTVFQSLLRYKTRTFRSGDSTEEESVSIKIQKFSIKQRPHKIRNQNIERKESQGSQYDEFVDLHICGYIPCLLIPPKKPSKKLVIFFHANAEDIGQAQSLCAEIGDFMNCYILAVEYPVYSIYGGSTSEDLIKRDTLPIWNFVTKLLNFKNTDIVVIGRSIGTGPALHLCTQANPSALCLVSPFTSIKDVTKYNYGQIASGFLKERFNNKEAIEKVKCPVLFIHGKEDKLISFEDSRTLYSTHFHLLP